MKQKKFMLAEDQIPQNWYNVQADMPVKPLPMLNPQTREPVSEDDLATLFCCECAKQELNVDDRWIEIPAPESCHAIAAAVREAVWCRENDEKKTILFCLSGHGLIDMAAYDQFLAGNIR